MFKLGYCLALVVTIWLSVSQWVVAAGPKSDDDRERGARIEKIAATLREQRQELQTDEWTMLQLEEYLNTAMWYVYAGKVFADTRYDDNIQATNTDLTQLVNRGFLPFWPDNPLRDWQPMQVLGPDDPFSEGDLVFSLCPPSHNSRTLLGLMPVSFDLFVYGPVSEYQTFGQFSLDSNNSEWSSPPVGALYGVSFYMQSEASRQENLRKSKEIADRQAKEKQNENAK
jgi:hypothetical protein